MTSCWVIASANAGKLAEFQTLFAPAGIQIKSQPELGIESVAETGTTFVENALIKARHASLHSGMPALADDSGLCVKALDGQPGLHSARYAGENATDSENIEKLLGVLGNTSTAERDAFFISVIVIVKSATDPAPQIAMGRWHGRVAIEPKGQNGFGYDPIFLVPEINLTAAQLTADQKNRLSHRAKALAELQKQGI